MSVTRASLAGGPAFLNFLGKNFNLMEDASLGVEPVWSALGSSLYGPIDDYYEDNVIKGSGTPMEYVPTGGGANVSVLWPYLNPVIGSLIHASDEALLWNSNNGDVFTVIAAAISKMPAIYLGVDKPMLGPVEFMGVVGDGLDAESDNSYYTISTGQDFTPPGIAKGNVKRQRYSASWGMQTGFTSFQAEEGWAIDFELKLEPVKIQSRTVTAKLLGVTAKAKCKPVGPTAAQIRAQNKTQGTGSASGTLGSANSADLVITGSGVSVTIKNAYLQTVGFKFGGKPLRNDEIGFVSTIDASSGTATPVAVLA